MAEESKETLKARVEENKRWLNAHLNDILKRYKGPWIAACDEKIVAQAGTIQELKATLGEKAQEAYIMKISKTGGHGYPG